MARQLNDDLAELRLVRQTILSRETRQLAHSWPYVAYREKLMALARRFLDACVAYATKKWRVSIHKAVLYTGSHLVRTESRLATYYPESDAQRWSEVSRAFTKFTFTCDDEVRHLLTEAIWQYGGAHCPAVFMGNDAKAAAEYPDAESVVIDRWQVPAQDYRDAAEHIQRARTDPARRNSDFNTQELWDLLLRAPDIQAQLNVAGNVLRTFLADPQPADTQRYGWPALQRLFAHVLFELNAGHITGRWLPPGLRNIFYLPDTRPGPVSGGAVIVFDSSEGGLPPTAEAVHDLQAVISDYYLSAVSAIESECLVWVGAAENWAYRDKYFDPPEKSAAFMDAVVEAAKHDAVPESMRLGLSTALRRIFTAFDAPQLLLKGYEQISARIFAGVCRLWNELKLETEVDPLSEDELAAIERSPTEFRRNSAGEDMAGQRSPFLRLLYNALNFEGRLRFVPSYREHFIHSFHVFCLGLWVVAQEQLQCSSQDEKWRFSEDRIRQWFYASLIHDVAYSLERIEDLADTYVCAMLEGERVRPVVPIYPHWGHLSLIREMTELFGEEEDIKAGVRQVIENFIRDGVRNGGRTLEENVEIATGRMLRTAFDSADHGLLSGLLVYHALKNSPRTQADAACLNKVMPAVFASMVHQCKDWKWSWPGHERPIDIVTPPEEGGEGHGVQVRLDELPIAHLLILCDTLAQFGREFHDDEHDDDEHNAKKRILLRSIERGVVSLVYRGWNFNKVIDYRHEKIWKKFYKPIMDLLGCREDVRGEPNKIEVIPIYRDPDQEQHTRNLVCYRRRGG